MAVLPIVIRELPREREESKMTIRTRLEIWEPRKERDQAIA